ncbi:MAG TPA: ABC transporter permease [Micromonosporaceae bacterium]|jgi:ABC-2 type transport system permease protein
MTTATISTPRPSALRRLTVNELRLFLRERTGPAFGVGFPLALLIIFGNIPYFNEPMKTYGGQTILDVYVPILVGFVITMLAVNFLPPTLAGYRERGVLRRLQTTPVGALRVLTAQLIVNVTTIVVSVLAVLLVGRFAFGVALPKQVVAFTLTAVLATLAMISIGLLVAAAAPTGRAANALGAVLFYVSMAFAGLWIPIQVMPTLLQHIAHATPLGAAVTAMSDASQGHWPAGIQLITLAGYTVVAGTAATKLFRWE